MQGQLRDEALDVMISTKCAYSGRTLHIETDSGLHCTVQEEDAQPLLALPLVNFEKLQDPSIIDAF